MIFFKFVNSILFFTKSTINLYIVYSSRKGITGEGKIYLNIFKLS